VTARLLDRQYKKIGPDMSAISQLESSVYSPLYNFRAEIHEAHLPPTTTILFKVWKLIGRSDDEFVTGLMYMFVDYMLIACFFGNTFFLSFTVCELTVVKK